MKIDLTYPLSRELLDKFLEAAPTSKDFDRFGHFGTHFDVMNKEFSLDDCERRGKIFDVRPVKGREIQIEDVDVSQIAENDFVLFFTGVLGEKGYGTPGYFKDATELSNALIQCLVDKKVSLIGLDMAGIRKSSEHPQADQYCADNGVFVIENLNNLEKLFAESKNKPFLVHTYPLALTGSSGLPARVVAEIQ